MGNPELLGGLDLQDYERGMDRERKGAGGRSERNVKNVKKNRVSWLIFWVISGF